MFSWCTIVHSLFLRLIMDSLERTKFLSKISRLYYQEGLTQQQIANKLNISRTKVSRYLDRARKENIVQIKVSSPEEDFSNLEYEIEERFKIKECNIVHSSENGEDILQAMAGGINNLLERILKDNSHVGIGWGSSLRSIANYINVSGKSAVKVIPMIGGLGKTGTGVHTNSVAKTIADGLGGISYMIHSPAVLDSREAREMVESDSSTKDIIELADRIDTALVGLSDIGPGSTLINTGDFKLEEFNYLKSLGVVGDVNLIFINENGQHVPSKIDGRIVRVPVEKLRKIRNIIGVAFGKQKIKTILGALNGNIINILFTDEDTAKMIIEQG